VFSHVKPLPENPLGDHNKNFEVLNSGQYPIIGFGEKSSG
jgi:hypothetical protein